MRPVYVVMGRTGEYSDREEWPVRAYLVEAVANEHAQNAERRGNALAAIHDGHDEDECAECAINYDDPYPQRPLWMRQNEFDPNFRRDYSGSRYSVMTVDMEEG